MAEKLPWMRRDDETVPAYEAFRTYLNLGKGRSLLKVCEVEGKHNRLISDWSRFNDWVERVRAFDVHLEEARTDGLIHQVAESRDKNLALMDKLRGLLDTRLDDFIRTKQDPTIRWTQAVIAMAKIEQNSLALKNDDKTTEKIERIEALVERAMGLEVTE